MTYSNLWACERGYLKSNLAFMLFFRPSQTLDDILSIDGDTASIKVQGPLYTSKYNLLVEALEAVSNNPDVKSAKLLVNSPGGGVDGVDRVWQAVRALSAKKTVTAYNLGTMASAAYWIASAANKIVATSPVAMTGSIGVYYVEYDYSKMDEKDGVQEVVIVSSNAPNKNVPAATDEGKQIIQDRLDAIESIFLARIAEGRNVSKQHIVDNYGQGDVFVAKSPERGQQDAHKRGLIDSVEGSFNTSKPKIKGAKKVKTLAELFVEHPELKVAYDAAIAQAGTDAVKAYQDSLKAVSPILANEEYPESVRAYVAKSLHGEVTVEAALGSVAVYDGLKAKDNVEAAANATENIEPTPGTTPVINNDGVVRTDEDVEDAVSWLRGTKGVK